MRKLLLAIMLIGSLSAYALHIECVGKAVQLTNQGDTLLLFVSTPELKTLQSVGEVDWYRLPDTITPVQTGTDYFYPEHGEGYMLKVNNQRDIFWVFDYDSLRPQVSSIEVEMSCEQTELYLRGKVPAMQYRRINHSLQEYVRTCSVQYMDAAWNDDTNTWEDSIVVTPNGIYGVDT